MKISDLIINTIVFFGCYYILMGSPIATDLVQKFPTLLEIGSDEFWVVIGASLVGGMIVFPVMIHFWDAFFPVKPHISIAAFVLTLISTTIAGGTIFYFTLSTDTYLIIQFLICFVSAECLAYAACGVANLTMDDAEHVSETKNITSPTQSASVGFDFSTAIPYVCAALVFTGLTTAALFLPMLLTEENFFTMPEPAILLLDLLLSLFVITALGPIFEKCGKYISLICVDEFYSSRLLAFANYAVGMFSIFTIFGTAIAVFSPMEISFELAFFALIPNAILSGVSGACFALTKPHSAPTESVNLSRIPNLFS